MDEVMISKLSEEQVNDEETVAGDFGPLHDSQEANPRLAGEIDHLKAKWLQKEINDYVAKDKELKSSCQEAYREGNESSSLARFPLTRLIVQVIRRSSRSSHLNSASDHVIKIGQVHEKALALSLISDTPLVSKFISAE